MRRDPCALRAKGAGSLVAAPTGTAAAVQGEHSREGLRRRHDDLRATCVHLAGKVLLHLQRGAGVAYDQGNMQLRLGFEQLEGLVCHLHRKLPRWHKHEQL